MTFFKVEHLSKKFYSETVLKDINFNLVKNEITALVGVNGAGKSTLLKIIIGLLSPSAGEVFFNGKSLEKNLVYYKKKIRFLSETNPVYEDLTTEEFLNFCNGLWGDSSGLDGEIYPIMEKLGLADRKDSLIKNLSKGLRQRVGLTASLMGDPELIILDEPFSGLDPRQLYEMRNFIKSLKRRTTLLFSSHLLGEINHLADRVIFINEGRIIGNEVIKKSLELPELPTTFYDKRYYYLSYQKSSEFKKESWESYLEKNNFFFVAKNNHYFIESKKDFSLTEILKNALKNNLLIKEFKFFEKSLEKKFLSYLR